jgi:hypothetical protein
MSLPGQDAWEFGGWQIPAPIGFSHAKIAN